MRKITIILLTILLMAALCLPAAAAGSASVTADSKSVKPGQQISFTVNVSGTGLRSIAVIPTYDKNVFELTDGQWLVDGMLSDFSVSSGDGVIAFESGTNTNGPVLRFTLKAKSSAAPGTYTVSAQVTVSDANGNSTPSVSAAQISIACNHSYDNSCDETCNRCGEKRTPPHNYGKAKPADDRKHTVTCADCGKTQTLDHTWDKGTVTTPATEEQPGVMTYTCTGCGQQRTEELDPAPHEHDFTGPWVTDETGHHHACACGEKQDEGTHTFGDAVLVTKPGCSENGLAQSICTLCGYAVEEDLGKLAHQWDEGTVTKEPTVQTPGEKIYACGSCGETKTEVLAQLPGQVTDTPAESQPQNPQEPAPVQPNTGAGPLLWVAIAEGAVILALAVVLILSKKKK